MSPPAKGPRARRRTYDWIDERDRAISEAVARRVGEHPELVSTAWLRVRSRLATASPRSRSTLLAWERILTTFTLAELLRFLVDPDEHAARLRQSTPFVGVLTTAERRAILRHYETL